MVYVNEFVGQRALSQTAGRHEISKTFVLGYLSINVKNFNIFLYLLIE